MIALKFEGTALSKDVTEGITEVASQLGIVFEKDGMTVQLEHLKSGIKVQKDGNRATIGFGRRVELFRALGLFVQHMDKPCILIEEQNTGEMLGTMVDNSRNAVMNVQSIKKLLRYMALMGHNTLQLYTEDTYEIEGYPYFGYLRGRFTGEELRECDDYAALLGIELVPCIQTLAHLNAALRWSAFREVHDCNDILLAGEEKTYALIESMLASHITHFKNGRK